MREQWDAEFTRLTGDHLVAFAKMVGERNVLDTPEALEPYGRDQHGVVELCPRALVSPKSVGEVAAVVSFAQTEGIPITPGVRGTKLAGGAAPLHRGVVLSLARMSKLRQLDVEARTIEAEAGATVSSICDAADSFGLLYPLAPSGEAARHIGGAVAVDASGVRSYRYGSTRQFVLDLEYVSATGQIHQLQGPVLQPLETSATQLLVGSEGTLAVFTAALLRLVKAPAVRCWFMVSFDRVERALESVIKARNFAPQPVSCELMDEGTLAAIRESRRSTESVPQGNALLHLEFFGSDHKQLEEQALAVNALAQEGGALAVYLSQEPRDQQRYLGLRESASQAVRRGEILLALDCSIPPSKLARFYQESSKIADSTGTSRAIFGNVGDGNLHTFFLAQNGVSSDPSGTLNACVDLVASLGGAVTGEHGVGSVRSRHLARFVDNASLSLMANLKATMDPRGILNPGTVLSRPRGKE